MAKDLLEKYAPEPTAAIIDSRPKKPKSIPPIETKELTNKKSFDLLKKEDVESFFLKHLGWKNRYQYTVDQNQIALSMCVRLLLADGATLYHPPLLMAYFSVCMNDKMQQHASMRQNISSVTNMLDGY